MQCSGDYYHRLGPCSITSSSLVIIFLQLVQVSENVNNKKDAIPVNCSPRVVAPNHPVTIPTSDENGNILISKRTATKRRKETFEAAIKIHGGKKDNSAATIAGLVDTISTKFPSDALASSMSTNGKLCNQVFPKIYNRKVVEFEASGDNMLRSIATYFSKGVMGKKKYRSVYRSLSMTVSKKKGVKLERLKVMSCKIPNILPYNKMIAHVNNIDIGELMYVKEELCEGLDDEEKANGCFRDLPKFLPLLASFYLKLVERSDEHFSGGFGW